MSIKNLNAGVGFSAGLFLLYLKYNVFQVIGFKLPFCTNVALSRSKC